jgi:hypothetical protein
MNNARLLHALVHAAPRVSVAFVAGSLALALTAAAQDANAPKGTVKDGYLVRQTIDLGGHIADYSGSGAMYDTLVNLQTGPRVLNQTLDMHAVAGSKHFLFDTLFTGSAGYGGDPNDFTTLRMSRGKLYEFNGLFRRDRQYFDYDLFTNPLIPAGVVSNGYTLPQIKQTPHLFNTVRRMTDTDLTLFPLSKFRIRTGYSQNISEGPTYSSIHQGADALLLQNWRNSTDTWMGAIDWKPIAKTVLTFQETVTHYKGNTSWELTGLNLQLSNGTPVTIGFDNVTAPAATTARSVCGARPAILDATTNPPTANACVNGFLQDVRSAPTRTLYPIEEVRFQSSDVRNFQTNGRISYSSVNMHLPNYFEYFNGLESRTTTRAFTIHGYSAAERINVSADYGFAWALSDRVTVTEQFDFQNWRQPAWNYLSEVDQSGTSMLIAPGVPSPADVTFASNFLGQRTFNNTFALEIQATPKATITVAYRFRDRRLGYVESEATDELPDGRNYTYRDSRNAAVLSTALRPTNNLKINGSVELGFASNVYVPVDAKNYQRYQLRGSWKPKSWATVSGTFFDTERKNGQVHVNYLAHNRSATAAATLAPSERYALDLSYGYVDVFSRVQNCFDDSGFVPSTSTPMPIGVPCGNAVNTATTTAAFYGTSYYDAPTQYGTMGLVYSPVKPLRSTFGYRMSAVDGHTEFLNPRNVPGSLQSQFQTPYATLAYTVAPGWGFSANWNYYSYGEGSPIGPTLPRSFRGNVYTLGMHYEF